MTPLRYAALELGLSNTLTKEEMDEGWCFCLEWDGMLLHKSWLEATCCDHFYPKGNASNENNSSRL